MNDGWGVVLGAVATLVGTALIPWIREAVTETRHNKSLLVGERRQAITDYVQALTEAVKYSHGYETSSRPRDARDRAVVAQTNLALLIGPGDRVLDELTADAVRLCADKKRDDLLGAIQVTLSAWHRGASSGEALSRCFEAEMERRTATPTLPGISSD